MTGNLLENPMPLLMERAKKDGHHIETEPRMQLRQLSMLTVAFLSTVLVGYHWLGLPLWTLVSTWSRRDMIKATWKAIKVVKETITPWANLSLLFSLIIILGENPLKNVFESAASFQHIRALPCPSGQQRQQFICLSLTTIILTLATGHDRGWNLGSVLHFSHRLIHWGSSGDDKVTKIWAQPFYHS